MENRCLFCWREILTRNKVESSNVDTFYWQCPFLLESLWFPKANKHELVMFFASNTGPAIEHQLLQSVVSFDGFSKNIVKFKLSRLNVDTTLASAIWCLHIGQVRAVMTMGNTAFWKNNLKTIMYHHTIYHCQYDMKDCWPVQYGAHSKYSSNTVSQTQIASFFWWEQLKDTFQGSYKQVTCTFIRSLMRNCTNDLGTKPSKNNPKVCVHLKFFTPS